MTNAERCKRWKAKNREKFLAGCKDWRDRNKDHVQQYRDTNKEVRLAQSKEWNAAHPKQMAAACKKHRGRYRYRRAVIDAIKLEAGCANPACSWSGSFLACDLDFHHIDRKTKSDSITHIIYSKASKIVEEIGKCCVLCAICHRRATHRQLDCANFNLCETSVKRFEITTT
jgi:hypothetical protein